MVHVVQVIDWFGGGILVVPAAVVNITPSMSSKAEAILNIFYISFCICKKKTRHLFKAKLTNDLSIQFQNHVGYFNILLRRRLL